MSRLDDLYALRGRIEDQIRREVAALERIAQEQRDRAERTLHRPGWAECGTDGGYYRHRRTLKEKPCNACKTAHSQAERDRAVRRRVA